LLGVEAVLRPALPPEQRPNTALPGDTVTDLIVGTVVSDMLMLAALPAPAGGE
jgi:hypothetical protein